MQTIRSIDFSILYWLHEQINHPLLDSVMRFLSFLGNGGVIWIAVGVLLLFFKKYRGTGIKVLLALLGVLIVYNWGLKVWVGRLRPFQIDPSIQLIIKEPSEFSFPSGHTTSSMAAATVLWLEKVPLRYAALVLALLISFSRLYLLVHFPSDVFAGLILGALMGWLLVFSVNSFQNKFVAKPTQS